MRRWLTAPVLPVVVSAVGTLGHLDKAQKDLEREARESPGFQEAHLQLAALYYRLNRKQDGERERQIVLRLNQKARQQGPQPEP